MKSFPTLFKTKAVMPTLLGCAIIAACGNAKTADADAEATAKPTTAATKLDSSNEATIKANIEKNLKASGFDATVNKVSATKMPGMYWVNASGLPAFFSDATGKYIVQGSIIEMGGEAPVDISAELQQDAAKDLLAKIDKKDMVIFPAKGETKGVVYAFTDVDCGYCRKLHSEMKDINEKGVEVRYLAWPRSPKSIPAMQNIWCADDRNAAMNTAKSGGTLTPKACVNPIETQVELGHQLGVRGTPAIFTDYGAQIGGYLPAAQLAKAAIE